MKPTIISYAIRYFEYEIQDGYKFRFEKIIDGDSWEECVDKYLIDHTDTRNIEFGFKSSCDKFCNPVLASKVAKYAKQKEVFDYTTKQPKDRK